LLGTLGDHTDSTNRRVSIDPLRGSADQPKRFSIMKKFHKFLALAALTPMLAACGPSAEDLCKHMMDVMKKEFGDAAGEASDEDTKKFMEQCVKEAEKEKEKIGAAEFNKQAKCVMGADKFEDMAKCKPEDKKE
jgi:hypothetical protein